jgi:hypothetical protein
MYSTGNAEFHGAIQAKESAVFHDLQWGTLKNSIFNDTSTVELMIDVFWLNFDFENNAFGFSQNDSARILSFLFIPTFCYMGWGKMSACAGVGQGTVNLNSSDEQRDYGTWNYQLLIQSHLTEKWTAHFLYKYVGNVEQTVANHYSHFSISALGLGLRREF